MMGEDEEGTLATLTAHLSELIEPCIAEHRGRVVKTTGDGLLAEFASVVDAVRCAVAFQEAMRERNGDIPEHRRIEFRIGVNLGDIIVLHDHVAQVHADTKLDALILRGVRVPSCNPLMKRNSTTHGIDHAGELGEQAVARRLDHPSPMLGDAGLDQFG